MESKSRNQIITALFAAIIIYIVVVFIPKFIIEGTKSKILATQSLELGLSLIAIWLLGKGRFADYGFRWPKSDSHWSTSMMRWLPVALISLAVGALATLAILITGAVGNPLAKQLTIPQIILFIWIFSSTIEEIFTRGFLQSHLAAALDTNRKIPFLKVDYPTFTSAFFFACMHLVLLKTGADLISTIIILLFTFSVGLLAGHQRACTGSLIPAIGVHMLANIGGLLGGILYSIFALLTGGKLPGS